MLEGLEPVRRRPGMYIGGTDEKALHHLFAEVIDNAMDEALAGHATFIEVELEADGFVSVTDNGRGIPVDPHPKFKNKSALEVIMCTLHAGGKFDSKVYETSGGLHGVGVSVANALSDRMEVEVARGQKLYRMVFERGKPKGKLQDAGKAPNRRGTKVRFHPDPEIFGPKAHFQPERVFKMTRSKAYLFGGVEIRWSCAKELVDGTDVPEKATFHFEEGLKDYLVRDAEGRDAGHRRYLHRQSPARSASTAARNGRWPGPPTPTASSTPTATPFRRRTAAPTSPGLRTALLRGLKDHAERVGQGKRAAPITSEDVMVGAGCMLSVFIREPEFQGQTKDRLATAEAQRIVENAIKDPFDHWLAGNPPQANKLLDFVVDRAEERIRRRQEKDISRKAATRKLRLPGKLADCTNGQAAGSEIFIVEGDSRRRLGQAGARPRLAGGAAAARQDPQRAVRRQGQAAQNAQLADLVQALGCGTGERYRDDDLRYEKVIVMTDADVDGAHIASLLITFFYTPDAGPDRARPPLSRGAAALSADPRRQDVLCARRQAQGRDPQEGIPRQRQCRDRPLQGPRRDDGGQLKETTMDREKRTLLQVKIVEADRKATARSVERLMGNKAEARFEFIQERAEFASDEMLDV